MGFMDRNGKALEDEDYFLFRELNGDVTIGKIREVRDDRKDVCPLWYDIVWAINATIQEYPLTTVCNDKSNQRVYKLEFIGDAIGQAVSESIENALIQQSEY